MSKNTALDELKRKYPNVDFTNPDDLKLFRGLIRGAGAKRWESSYDLRKLAADAMGECIEEAAEIEDVTDRINCKVSAARTIVAMEAQNQADEHHADRRDDGPAVSITLVSIAPPVVARINAN